MPVLPPRRGRGGARRHEHRPLRRAPAPLRRSRAVRRDHAPEAHDGGGRRALRRDDGRRRHLPDRLAPPAARRARCTRPPEPSAAASVRRDVATWAELLGDAEDGDGGREERSGFFSRLRDSLGKSRRALTAELGASFDPADEEAWERLEDGAHPRGRRRHLRPPSSCGGSRRAASSPTSATRSPTRSRRCSASRPCSRGRADKPTVVLVVGVNGTGKTTTIGKLAQKLAEHGRSVLLGAADTFRAAAEEQLEIWAERAGADFVGGSRGADPAAVAFDAVEAGRARGRDVVIVDTAGRLHTQGNLMEELAKVRRVIAGRLDGAPHETLLVVDATTGQNGLQQARLFAEAAGVTGVALTKLDGSAKGGVAVAIAHELGLPVKLVGVGEGIDDLRPFDARDYARALVGAADSPSFAGFSLTLLRYPAWIDTLRRVIAVRVPRTRRGAAWPSQSSPGIRSSTPRTYDERHRVARARREPSRRRGPPRRGGGRGRDRRLGDLADGADVPRLLRLPPHAGAPDARRARGPDVEVAPLHNCSPSRWTRSSGMGAVSLPAHSAGAALYGAPHRPQHVDGTAASCVKLTWSARSTM